MKAGVSGKSWDLPLPFLFVLGLIMVIGLVTLFSATGGSRIFQRQIFWNLIGITAMFFLSLVDLRKLERYCHFIYLLVLLLLLVVFIKGKTAMGAQRWLHLVFFRIQPSELAKLALVLALARILMNQEGKFSLGNLWKPVVLVAPAFLLTLLQPDLGTALIILALSATLVLVKGVGTRSTVAVGLVVLVALPFAWQHLKPYQKKRVMAFINPQAVATSAGYHVINSKTAIGSGGIWGKGFSKGSQTRLQFVPEKHTDFIFSVFAEEKGFVGSVTLIAVYFFLVVLALSVAAKARDAYGFYIATGVAVICSLHFAVNLGMTMGLLPVVGVPLPLMSYGGSSVITTYLGAGLIIAVYRMRTG